MAIQLGRQLVARGDHVVFLGSSLHAAALQHEPFRYGHIDRAMSRLGTTLPTLLADSHADTLILVDITTVYARLAMWKQDIAVIDRLNIPVVAFDVWDIRRTGVEWDVGVSMPMPRQALGPARRLIPAPLAAPVSDPGVYRALPDLPSATRDETRTALGLSPTDRLVLIPEARWQTPEGAQLAWQHRAAVFVPELVGSLFARAGHDIHVLHVAPAPSITLSNALGDRYRYQQQLAPAEFGRLVHACDLMFSLNTAGTTIASAIAAGIPVLLAINSFAGETVEEISAQLPNTPSEALRTWLAKAVPLARFRVWPLGLHRFLAPVVDGTAYNRCMRTVELLDEAAVLEALRDLLDIRAPGTIELREHQAMFVERARHLPTALEVFDGYFSGLHSAQ